MKDSSSLDPILREVVLCKALSTKKIPGLEEKIFEEYQKEKNQVAAETLRQAVTCTKKVDFIKKSVGLIKKSVDII